MASVAQAIVTAANDQGLDPLLALEVASQESSLNPLAVGSKGEIGVFQLMPATAAQLGVDPTDPNQNIAGGVSYLSGLIAQFGGDTAAGLAAYNCGPTCVQNAMNKYGADWFSHIPASTQAYVNSILGNVGSAYSVQFAPVAAAQAAGAAVQNILAAPGGASSTTFPWAAVAIAAGVVLFLYAAARN